MREAQASVIAGGLFALMALAGCSAPARGPSPQVKGTARLLLASPPNRPFVMFISQAADDTFRHVALAPLDAPDGPRYVTPLICDRVHFARNRGVCLTTDEQSGGPPRYRAQMFDENFKPLQSLALTGPPSRTRVSPDGRRAAVTVFEEGHSYADAAFSTRTTIVDTMTGALVSDLERFTLTRDGRPFASVDFNFWGVTFKADGNGFFATVRSAGAAYLIEGDVDARQARVLMAGAECPSLSPDQTHVAFKKRLGGPRGWWQLAVVEPGTLVERALTADTRSVDDQVEWLDAANLIYFLPERSGNIIWRLRTDVDQAPQVFIRDASSPAVVRD